MIRIFALSGYLHYLHGLSSADRFSTLTSGIFERVIIGFSNAGRPGPLILEYFRAILIELGET